MRNVLSCVLLMLASMAFAQSTLVDGKDFVYVCRDAGAGAYEAFPDVCRLQDGRLMCVFYAGWTHVSLPDDAHPKGGRVSACYSSDEGKTWTSAVTVYDGPDDDRDPSVVQLADGRILCNFFSLRSKKEGGGYDGLGSWLVESADNGVSWSEPRLISDSYYCSSPIREIAGGRVILGLYKEVKDDSHGAVIYSDDGARTWSAVVDIDNGGLQLDAETDIITLKDGKLYAAQRTAKESMRYATSGDRGQSWTVSQPMGFPGHSPYLHRAPGDIVLCAHRLPKTSLHYSLDECATWKDGGMVDDFIGAYPSMVTLKDDSVLIVYYEEGEGSSIRARKFRGTPAGIQWLTWE